MTDVVSVVSAVEDVNEWQMCPSTRMDANSLGTPLALPAGQGLSRARPGGRTGPATREPARRANRVVRKTGFEPARSCDRQPLKLVRLPVPPLPREVGRAGNPRDGRLLRRLRRWCWR